VRTKSIWRLHSWLGLVAGVPLFVIAASGSLLVYKDSLNALLMPERVLVEPSGEGRRGLDALLGRVERALPEHEVVGWTIHEAPGRADWIYVVERGESEWELAYLDPYSGALLSEPASLDASFTGWLLDLHYTLLAGPVGMAVSAAVAVALVALGVTGLLVYRRFWKSLFRMRWRSGARVLAGNLHKRIGAVSAPVFLTLGVTGAYWNIAEVVHETEHALEGKADPVMRGRYYADSISLEELRRRSVERVERFELTYVLFPYEKGRPFTLYGRLDGQSVFRSRYNSRVSFDAQSGERLGHAKISEQSVARQAIDAFEPLHFGTFGGPASKAVWCVLGFAPGVLALSGFFVRWKRR